MKLYSSDMSPFAARPRLSIYAKGLDVEILPPPGGNKSPEYLAVNPVGKIPALVLDDGTVILESETIVEFLEDAFPQPSLRPSDPKDLARARTAARVGDLYVGTPLSGLFMQAMAETKDPAVVAARLGELDKGMEYLNLVLSGDRYAAGPTLTTGDVGLAPMLFYVPMMGMMFGRDLMGGHPKVAAYLASVSDDPHVARVFAEIQRGLAAWRKQRGG